MLGNNNTITRNSITRQKERCWENSGQRYSTLLHCKVVESPWVDDSEEIFIMTQTKNIGDSVKSKNVDHFNNFPKIFVFTQTIIYLDIFDN